MTERHGGDYVTQLQLRTALEPLAEFRERLYASIDQLQSGQATISDKLSALVIQVTVANGRTGKIETTLSSACSRMEEIEDIATAAKTEAAAAHTAAESVQLRGCHQMSNHVRTMSSLARAGALVDDEEPGGGLATLEPSWPRLRKHGPRVAAGGGLVALGAALPHLLEWAQWLASLIHP